MPCRVKAQTHMSEIEWLAIGYGDDIRVGTQSSLCYFQPRLGTPVPSAARPRMVGVSVGDDGMLDRPPWIDVEASRLAAEATIVNGEQISRGERQVAAPFRVVPENAPEV